MGAAAGHAEIGTVKRGSLDADQHLPVAGLGLGYVGD
jgi:hypothetical protein